LAYRIFERGRDRQIYFDISQPTNVYLDNTVQFSASIRDFALDQRALFKEVQSWVTAGRGRPDTGFYQTTNMGRRVPLEEALGDETLAAIVPTLKSIFRQIRKRVLSGIRLSNRRVAGMWRKVEGSEIPRSGYRLAGYLDWLCFWYDVEAPANLRSKKARSSLIRKLRAWLESKRAHDVFTLLKGKPVKQWLIMKILAHEVAYFMVRQLETSSVPEPVAGATESNEIVYHRTAGPAAWAVVVRTTDETCTFHFFARRALIETGRPCMTAAEQRAAVASLSH
jgi:hypothetical protein